MLPVIDSPLNLIGGVKYKLTKGYIKKDICALQPYLRQLKKGQFFYSNWNWKEFMGL